MGTCSSCAGGCGSCGGCRSHVLLLTPLELSLLQDFAALAFLPVACTQTDDTPVYHTPLGSREQVSAALCALRAKQLISIDYALPLQGFDYAAYTGCSIRGSMALTAAGQDALASLDIQGCGDADGLTDLL